MDKGTMCRKFVSMIWIAILCVCITSCNDDEKEEPSVDYPSLLKGHWMHVYGESEYETLSFTGSNSILYEYLYTDEKESGGYGVYASGTYTIDGNILTAFYDYVDLMDATSLRGFYKGQSKTVQYTIESIRGDKMILIDNSTWSYLSFEKYAEAK